jgi:hypothetical protein
MTVGELLGRISSRELSKWMALYRVEAEERARVQQPQPPGLGY